MRLVLVTGGRHYDDYDVVCEAMERAAPDFVVQGGATGADALARDWCRENTVPCATVEAYWKRLGGSAGPRRNGWMLMLKPSFVLAFPGDRGTEDMIEQAEDLGIPVDRVEVTYKEN